MEFYCKTSKKLTYGIPESGTRLADPFEELL